MFSDMIRRTLRTGDFHVTVVEDPTSVITEFNKIAANIVLLEVTGYTPWKLSERMELRKLMRRIDPDCKIVFMVDEKAEPQVAEQVKQAKMDGLIDQFIFSSISAGYLKAVLEATV
jgi:DNA-binding NtrC family response regulator